IALAEHPGRAERRAGGAAQEVDGAATARGLVREERDEIAARDALRERLAEELRRPDERHPVGDAQIGGVVEEARGEVAVEALEDVEVGRHAPTPATLIKLVEDEGAQVARRHLVDPHAEEIDAREVRGRARAGQRDALERSRERIDLHRTPSSASRSTGVAGVLARA